MAYGCGQTPAEPTIRALLELISDGTYPEDARILLAMTPDNRPYLPSTLIVELVVAVAAGIVVAIPIWRRLARRKGTIFCAHGRATGSSPVRR